MRRRMFTVATVVALAMLGACSSGGSAEGPTEPEPTVDEQEADEDAPTPSMGTIEAGATVSGEDIALTADQEAELAPLAEGKLIGIVCATMSNEYHKLLCEGAKERAEELGFTAEIFDAQEDANRELQGVEGFISKGAAAILEDSLGGDAITAQIQDAAEKGVVIVQLANRTFADAGAVTVAVSDETIAEAAGRAAGEYAAEHHAGETIKAVMLDYPDIPSLIVRADMIEAAFKAAFPTVEFLPRVLGGTAENGYNSVEVLAQQHRDIRAVVGINDAGNLGAYQALLAAGFGADDTFIFGIDCDPQAVDLIEEGTMYRGCVDTNPWGTGKIGVDAFGLLLLGQTVPANIDVPVVIRD